MKKEFSSFRDSSGFIFFEDNECFRQINTCYKDNYSLACSSGLYKELIAKNLLLPFEETTKTGDFYKIIKPKFINFISYPCEWSFDMLKDAALLTLKIQEIAIEKGMTLKDASAYNIQFINSMPIFIDTLSFEKFNNEPWIAYEQFCKHFLAPLCLAKFVDENFLKLFNTFINGIPLDFASKLLPKKTLLNPDILMHIHLHSKTQDIFDNKSSKDTKPIKMKKEDVLKIIYSLKNCIKKLSIQKTNKKIYLTGNTIPSEFISRIIKENKPKNVLIFNDNIQEILSDFPNIQFIVCNDNPQIIENLYNSVKIKKYNNVLPLVLDISNPTTSFGFATEERISFIERMSADITIMPDIIEQLNINQNIPIDKIVYFLSKITRQLIVSSIGNTNIFEQEFSKYFNIITKQTVSNHSKTTYFMEKI